MLTQCILYRQLTNDSTYIDMESSLRDWLLGCNPWGVCMIVELPGAKRYPTQPHSFIINEKIGNTTGGLVDGPVYIGIFNSLRGVNMKGGINFGLDTCWYNPKQKTAPQDLELTYTVHGFDELGRLLIPV